jgi:hypothetical protein
LTDTHDSTFDLKCHKAIPTRTTAKSTNVISSPPPLREVGRQPHASLESHGSPHNAIASIVPFDPFPKLRGIPVSLDPEPHLFPASRAARSRVSRPGTRNPVTATRKRESVSSPTVLVTFSLFLFPCFCLCLCSCSCLCLCLCLFVDSRVCFP